ncbi:pyridoxal phosphate-dependent aminotransferase [Riemerella anatipestifer]|uniref:pyridoxal phosphate-dependent aminotransferase n=1 Tax=Riemerella anatipestifer TaxID=34085 RepID=UPI0007EC3307|nr:pyridoxal phosphate-dependent aminotransferase [Riemerella anatipestifer]AZZ57826.1 pyridoxal phosphate-dependent aminotransferase [Riemerella anatipestifer]MBT0572083.1 pyridoxal phosphate-dependent aminotransferase [Riemerella anatipestifer]MCO7319471.1 pyridoxal phosphate-dependent aminotransferase [Riemerella anatipestifer]MCQ4155785.1 pyridoxal phosphate-dependent aminotransferase [Riemerella anatipestifer]MCQ4181717.1 pyridoxal phosphate-dependent aminotransferase [Riemerella anatipes
MSKLSKRVERLSYSQTFVMSNKARAMKAEGIDVISMTLGEPDFDVPEKIRLAAKKAIDDNYSHYSPITGFPELRQAICNKLKRDNNLDYSPSQICVSTGAKQSISNVLAALIDDEDEVILPSPYWVSYDEMVRMMGGNSVFIETSIETDFKVTPKQIEAAITPKTKAILFSSPCNPSGSFYTYEELEAIANTLAKYPEIVIISDEIYEFLNYEGKHTSIAQFPQVFNQTVVINGVSKAYAMTGWRIGYSAAPQWLASACDKIQGQVTSGANTIAQIASITALEMQPLELQPMIDKFKERRNLAHQLISEIPGFKCNLPKGAFYLFPDVSYYFGKTLGDTTINNSDDFAMFLLEKAHVATVGGVSFGDTNCIRLSYATSDEQIIEAMKRIKETLAKYNV